MELKINKLSKTYGNGVKALQDITLEIGVESHDRLYRNPFLDPLQPHELKADIATPKEI